MSENKVEYELYPDSHNRQAADIAEGVTVGIKVLSLTDTRRIERNEHAYVVLDLITPFGPMRIRDIRILWSEPNQQFFLRWRQWKTGIVHDGRPRYLDIAGPRDKETRVRLGEAILAVFKQILATDTTGTHGNDTLGQNSPELVAIHAALEQEKVAVPVDGPAADDLVKTTSIE